MERKGLRELLGAAHGSLRPTAYWGSGPWESDQRAEPVASSPPGSRHVCVYAEKTGDDDTLLLESPGERGCGSTQGTWRGPL